MMTKGELMQMLVRVAREHRSGGIRESLERNRHMNTFRLGVFDERLADAVIVDYLNMVGRSQGMDLGLYTKDLT